MKKITIAIDGLVATGKGTTAKGVAQKLGYIYIDTGAMYRAVTLYAMRNGGINKSNEEKIAMMTDIHLAYVHNKTTDSYDMYMNGENIEQEIRTKEVAMEIFKIAHVAGVRKVLTDFTREYAKGHGIVADGRDMGSVVFPDAELKFFLTCDTETRVLRRFEQKQLLGIDANKNDIRTEIEHRDAEDYLGPDAVNKKASDAIVVDTTHHSIKSQIGYIVGLAKKTIG